MIGRVVDRFRIVARLGQGGMASVWKAEDTLLRRPVALKLLAEELAQSPDARRRFLREARAAAALSHPGVAAVYGAGEVDDLVYIALALIDGETVSDCAARQPFEPGDALRLGLAVGEALGHAHSRGVIHRDITGRNIMIARDGRVVVLDFGLAFMTDHTRLTTHQSGMGTAAYMAPETALGRDADARTDLYGLGVVLYEAITGTLPFRHSRSEALLYAAVHEEPEPPSARRAGLPAWVDPILLKALAKRADERYPDAEALLAALRACGGSDATGVSHAWVVGQSGRATATPVRGEALAVEPFRDLSAAGSAPADWPLLVQGLAEAVRAGLASSPGLEVVPMTDLGDVAEDVRRERARRAGARRMLSGSARRLGERVRLAFSLTDLSSDAQMAGGNLDGSVGELFDLEDRLVAEVLAALRIAPGAPAGGHGPRDAGAHHSYLTAIAHLQHPDDETSVDEAIATLESLRATQPATASVEAALARAYLKKYQRRSGREHELAAADACQRALALDPHAADVFATLGDLHRSTGRHADAIDAFRRALDLRPESYDAWIGISFAYMEAGRDAEAEEACRRAIALRPEHAHGYQRLGVLFCRQGRFAEAVAPLQQAIRVGGENPAAHVNLAGAYYSMDRLDEAAEEYRRAVAIKPTAAACANLGTVLFDQGRYPEAVEALEKAVSLKPSDPRLWRNLASASELVRGRSARQRECLERAAALLAERLEINANSAEDWIQLAASRADLGQRTLAVEAIDHALALAPHDATVLAVAGQALNSLEERDAARSRLVEAIEHGFASQPLLRNPALAWLAMDTAFQRALAERSVQRTEDHRTPNV